MHLNKTVSYDSTYDEKAKLWDLLMQTVITRDTVDKLEPEIFHFSVKTVDNSLERGFAVLEKATDRYFKDLFSKQGVQDVK